MEEYYKIVAEMIGAQLRAYNTDLTRMLKSVTASVFLNQLLYWSSRTGDVGGWIYKTSEDFEAEIGLTRHQQLSAQSLLEELGIITVVLKPVDNGRPSQVRHYRVELKTLYEMCGKWRESRSQMLKNQQLTAGGGENNSSVSIPPDSKVL